MPRPSAKSKAVETEGSCFLWGTVLKGLPLPVFSVAP